jgi:hypothetical protein
MQKTCCHTASAESKQRVTQDEKTCENIAATIHYGSVFFAFVCNCLNFHSIFIKQSFYI